MDHPTYPPTDGNLLKSLREDAGVSQDDVAAFIPTTRQALRRWENHPRLPYLKAEQYRKALASAVASKTQAVA